MRVFSTAWKVSKYGVFSGPYFPTFGLNTERYGVSLRIQSKCGKRRTRENSVFGHFSRSAGYLKVFFMVPGPFCYRRVPLDSGIKMIILEKYILFEGMRTSFFDHITTNHRFHPRALYQFCPLKESETTCADLYLQLMHDQLRSEDGDIISPWSGAVAWRCPVNKVFSKTSQEFTGRYL